MAGHGRAGLMSRSRKILLLGRLRRDPRRLDGARRRSSPPPTTPAPARRRPRRPTPAAPVPAGAGGAGDDARRRRRSKQGDSLTAPRRLDRPSRSPRARGGTDARQAAAPRRKPTTTDPTTETEVVPGAEATPIPRAPVEPFEIPSIPSSSCASSGVPPVLIPIYQRAAATYGLGPQGPAVLAGINAIETAFGSNLNISSAGAMGWMQFIPSSWEAYGVDANGDGVEDPYNPEDAIFAAASYLSAAGMPADTYNAIYAYNHADWYVEDVLANAACYSRHRQQPGRRRLLAHPAAPGAQLRAGRRLAARQIPDEYMTAFESAAARYELGKRGVWALAAVARLESNFGAGMGKKQLQRIRPARARRDRVADLRRRRRRRRPHPPRRPRRLGRDPGPADLVARQPPRRDLHPQPGRTGTCRRCSPRPSELEGDCKVTTVDWAVALPGTSDLPINWDNLTLSNELELHDLTTGAIDPRIVGLIGAITQEHQLTISSLRSDHSRDDGQRLRLQPLLRPGDGHRRGRRGLLHRNRGRRALREPRPHASPTCRRRSHPTELIYCFDVDGPGRSVRAARPLRSRPRRLRRLRPDSAPRRRTRPLGVT